MAGNGLPIYYKNSKLVGPQSSKKRWKEYYLLVCTVVGFIILIAGVLWFVPSVEEDKSYSRAYSSFTGPSVGGVTDVSEQSDSVNQLDRPISVQEENILKRNADSGPEIDPRQRRLEEDRREPVPVPGRGRPNNIEGEAGVVEQKNEQQGDAVGEKEQGVNNRDEVGQEVANGDGTQGKDVEGENIEAGEQEEGQREAENEDPVAKERREKIVEV